MVDGGFGVIAVDVVVGSWCTRRGLSLEAGYFLSKGRRGRERTTAGYQGVHERRLSAG